MQELRDEKYLHRPLLFLLYINNLPFALRKAHGTMYADDTAISYSLDKIEEIDVAFNAEIACLEAVKQPLRKP